MKLLIDVILLLVIVGFTVVGFRKGFIRMLISFVKNIAAFIVAYTFSPRLSAWLKEQVFMEKAKELIGDKISQFLGTEASSGVDIMPLLDAEHSEFFNFIEKMGLDLTEFQNALSETGGTLTDKVGEYIADPCVSAVSTVVAFVALFVGALIVISIISLILSAVTKLPLIKGTNRFFGGVLGFVLGCVSSVVIASLIRLLLPYFSDAVLTASIEEGATLYNLITDLAPAFLTGIK